MLPPAAALTRRRQAMVFLARSVHGFYSASDVERREAEQKLDSSNEHT